MQLACDLNYSPVLNFGEDDFIIAGPGCLKGIRKCFGLPSVFVPEAQAIIYHCVEEQEVYFEGLGYEPVKLFGQRRLHAIDVQNCFCEIDKYARVAHSEFRLKEGEKIKNKFKPLGPLRTAFFPPKWNINA